QAARIRRRHLPRVLRDAGPLPHGRRALENLERKDARAPDQDTSARGGRRRKLVARRRRPRPGRRPHHDDLPVAAHAGDLLPLRPVAHEGSSGEAEAQILWAKDFAMSPSISPLLLAALVGGAEPGAKNEPAKVRFPFKVGPRDGARAIQFSPDDTR